MSRYAFPGFLNKKPELKYSQTGTAFTHFSVCESWRKKDKDTDTWVEIGHQWWRCVAFNSVAEVCATFEPKTRVGVSGRLRFEKYTDKEGNKKISPVIIVDFMGLRDIKSYAKVDKPEGSEILVESQNNPQEYDALTFFDEDFWKTPPEEEPPF